MSLMIALRADNAIILYDEDDPRSGVVIASIAELAKLVSELNAAVTRLHGEEAWRRARMRAAVEAVARYDERLN